MDHEQRADLGVSLFIPYRYIGDWLFKGLHIARSADCTLAQCRAFQPIAPTDHAPQTLPSRHR
jgi:hypothetical protein